MLMEIYRVCFLRYLFEQMFKICTRLNVEISKLHSTLLEIYNEINPLINIKKNEHEFLINHPTISNILLYIFERRTVIKLFTFYKYPLIYSYIYI